MERNLLGTYYKMLLLFQGWKKPGFFRKNPTHPGFLEKPMGFFKKPGLNGFFKI